MVDKFRIFCDTKKIGDMISQWHNLGFFVVFSHVIKSENRNKNILVPKLRQKKKTNGEKDLERIKDLSHVPFYLLSYQSNWACYRPFHLLHPVPTVLPRRTTNGISSRRFRPQKSKTTFRISRPSAPMDTVKILNEGKPYRRTDGTGSHLARTSGRLL